MIHAPLSRKPESASPSGRLRIGEPNDSFEQEADRVAEEIMAGGRAQWSLSSMGIGAPLRRKCDCGGSGECEECKEKKLQRKAAEGAVNPGYAPPIVGEVLRSSGQPLDAAARAFFEPRFGHDFSHVRIHADAEAWRSAKSVGAKAYTVGDHIVFGEGRSAPSGRNGGSLLAHELAHVVQQNGAADALQRAPDDDDEQEMPKGHKLRGPRDVGLSLLRPDMCGPSGCVTDDTLEALSQGQSLEEARRTIQARKREQSDENTRRQKTVARFESLEEYELKREYTRTLKRWNSNPRLKKIYDLKTLEEIAEKRFPNARWIDRQLYHELLSAPEWTAGQKVQLDHLKERIANWTTEEQNIARDVFWQWTELERGGRARIVAKPVIIEMTRQRLEQWLRKVDSLQQEGCRKDPPGFIEKLYRIHGIDRCQPWFENESSHGPSELAHFRRYLRLRLSEDESPESLVFESVLQYRRQSNPDELMKAMQAAGIVGGLVNLAGVYGSYASLRSAGALRTATEALPHGQRELKPPSSIESGITASPKPALAEPSGPPVSAQQPLKDTPTLSVKQGQGQGSGKPTGLLRDVDAASRGVKVDASHPIFKNKVPANDSPPPPQEQAAKIAVHGSQDLPHAQNINPTQRASPRGGNADPTRMAKRPITPDSELPPWRRKGPPAEQLDPGEGELSKKQRKGEAPKKELVSTAGKTRIKDSAWLKERLLDPNNPERFAEDQRLFLQWIEDGHYGEHPHLTEYSDFADGLLEEWNETLSERRQLGPRRRER